MTTLEADKLVWKVLQSAYALCKIVPIETEYKTFLELQEPGFVKTFETMTAEQAFREIFYFKHWYIRKYFAKEVDELMQLNLPPDLFNHYKKKYVDDFNQQQKKQP
jgi:hypothetical protein